TRSGSTRSFAAAAAAWGTRRDPACAEPKGSLPGWLPEVGNRTVFVTVLARGSDPPEPPDGSRPRSFVAWPWPLRLRHRCHRSRGLGPVGCGCDAVGRVPQEMSGSDTRVGPVGARGVGGDGWLRR